MLPKNLSISPKIELELVYIRDNKYIDFMRNLISFISAGIILSSCAYHSGTIGDLSTQQPVTYEDLAIGVATSNHFLGLGGINKDALLFDARRNLIANRPLGTNELYGAQTVDVKHSFYLLGYKTKITITADIVTPLNNASTSSTIYSERYLAKVNLPVVNESIFSVGDSVYNSNTYDVGVIQSFIHKNDVVRARVLFVDHTKSTRLKTYSIDRLYVIKNIPSCKLQIGSTLENKQVVAIGQNGIILFGPLGLELKGMKSLHQK